MSPDVSSVPTLATKGWRPFFSGISEKYFALLQTFEQKTFYTEIFPYNMSKHFLWDEYCKLFFINNS